MNENYFTLKEISERIKTPILYLRRMVKEDKLIGTKIGKTIKVKESDVCNFIDSCKCKHDR